MPRQLLVSDRLMRPIAHFSHAVRVGNVVHLGATAGVDARARPVGTHVGVASARAQTERMLENARLALRMLDADLRDVVRVKGWLADWRDFAGYNEVYTRFFQPPFPARSTVGSAGFPLAQLLVEVEMVAIVGGPHEEVRSDRLPPALAPYAQGGVLVGDTLYTAAVPAARDGSIVGVGNVTAQAERTLEVLALALEAAGLGLRDLVQVGVTLTDPRDFPAFEAVYRRVLRPPWPARSVGFAPLGHPELLVELEAVAVAGGGEPVLADQTIEPLGATSPGIRAGDLLFVAGQLGYGHDAALAPDAEAQTRACWERVLSIARRAGFERLELVRTNNTLSDWRDYPAYNAGYGASVIEPYPPRATVSQRLLDPRARVQIEALFARGAAEAIVLTGSGA